MGGLVGGGVSPFVIVEMRKRHVADAEVAEDTHDSNVVADHVAAFDAHERGNFALFAGTADFSGSAAEYQVLGITADVFVDGVDLIERFLDGRRAHDAAVDPD